MLSTPEGKIILASRSPARQSMMQSAGIRFATTTAPVDEEALREAGLAEGINGVDMATALAEAKALRVSMLEPGAFVIGSDQLLECEGVWYGKPASTIDATQTLLALSGKTHQLITAAVVFQGGRRIWHHCESPRVSIRNLDSDTIEQYLKVLGDDALATPGIYKIEDRGAQILSRVDGCPYAVMGMPLLHLMAFLRERGLVPEGEA